MCLQYLAFLITGLVLHSQMQWSEVQVRRGLCSIDKDRFVPNYTTSASQPPLRARTVNIHGFHRVYVGGMVTSTLCRPILVRPTAATLRLVLVPCLFCLKFGIKYVSKFILGPSILSNLTFTPQIYYYHETHRGLSTNETSHDSKTIRELQCALSGHTPGWATSGICVLRDRIYALKHCSQ